MLSDGTLAALPVPCLTAMLYRTQRVSRCTVGVRPAFTLVELLVVLGVVAMVVSLLLPSLVGARRESERLRCKANLHQIGQAMVMYANSNRGVLFPPLLGVNVPPSERWMTRVFKFDRLPDPPSDDPAYYTPKVMLCPSDATDVVLDPRGAAYIRPGELNLHTYVLSHNVGANNVTYSRKDLGGLSPGEFVIMGEKVSSAPDYYMGTRAGQPSEYKRVVDFNRHGRAGSNYLHLDMHVDTLTEGPALRGIDPWYYTAVPSTN